MTQLNDEVERVVDSFVANGELFTALDVSNKVKMAMPSARHSEVRDLVRELFATELSPLGWARTPIQVELANGQKETALLYHPLTDSWDLDRKYDAQKRAQSAIRPVPGPSLAAQALGVVTPAVPVTPVKANPMPKAVSTPALPTRALWDQLFNSQPSLFPRK